MSTGSDTNVHIGKSRIFIHLRYVSLVETKAYT